MIEEPEEKLEEITEQEFTHSLMLVQKSYLQEITEYTKLYHNCDDIEHHINFLHANNYQVTFYKTEEGSITYEYKEKEPVGFGRSG